MNIRELINEKFTEVFTLYLQGNIAEAQDVLEELISQLEVK